MGVTTVFCTFCSNNSIALHLSAGISNRRRPSPRLHRSCTQTESPERKQALFALFLVLVLPALFTVCLPCCEDIIMSSYQSAEGTSEREMLYVNTFHHFLPRAPKRLLRI